MTYQHQELASGRWRTLSLAEQLAHVGSEVSRAIRWRAKAHQQYAELARDRALELLWLTIDDPKHRTRLKELTRLYEVLVDYLAGENEYETDPDNLERYFLQFTYQARSNRSRQVSLAK